MWRARQWCTGFHDQLARGRSWFPCSGCPAGGAHDYQAIRPLSWPNAKSLRTRMCSQMPPYAVAGSPASSGPPESLPATDPQAATQAGDQIEGQGAGVAARSASLNLDPAPAHKGVGACENDGPEHGKWACWCRTRLQHRADPDQRLGSIAHPLCPGGCLESASCLASEWVPARKELRATEEEAVRALWQIADDTGALAQARQVAVPREIPGRWP